MENFYTYILFSAAHDKIGSIGNVEEIEIKQTSKCDNGNKN